MNRPATSTAKTPQQVIELLLQLHRELGMTLVLVTHDLTIAERASRTIRMKDGRVVSDRGLDAPTASP